MQVSVRLYFETGPAVETHAQRHDLLVQGRATQAQAFRRFHHIAGTLRQGPSDQVALEGFAGLLEIPDRPVVRRSRQLRQRLQGAQRRAEGGSDAAGNLVARISPPHLPREQARRAAVRLLAHLDEIAMIVKRVEADGTLRVVALGGAQPVSFGVCPVQILAGEAVLDGVLSYGSMHATGESPQGSDVLSGAVHWRDVHVVTRRSAEELANLGVRPGTRVVLNRLWRRPLYFQDCVAAHFLDDRAPLLAVLGVAREIARRRDELHGDLYLVLTTMEEESNAGALFAARRLPGDISIAVEVGPTVAEYGTRLCRDPIVNSGDSKGYYSRHVTDRLLRAAERCQYQPQAALLVDFASDASALLSHGEAAQVGCIGIPTENTHGFEIVLEEGIEACRRTLVEFLVQPPDDEA